MKKRVTLYADEGMVITDGVNYGTTISVSVNGDDSKYYEITKAEYDRIQEEKQREIEMMELGYEEGI